MAKHYVVSASKASGLLYAAVGALTQPHARDLIVACVPTLLALALVLTRVSKIGRLEIYRVQQAALELAMETPVYARPSALLTFRPAHAASSSSSSSSSSSATSTTDLVLLATESQQLCVLRVVGGAFETVGSVDLRAVHRQPSDNTRVLVAPSARCIIAHLYVGIVHVVPLSASGVPLAEETVELRLEEPRVLDLVCLRMASDMPIVAVLYEDAHGGRHVRTYAATPKELTEGPWNLPNVERHASHLVAVKDGAVVVVGRETVTFHTGAAPVAVAMPRAQVCAVGVVDDGRILMGDMDGQLRLILLRGNQVVVEPLGSIGLASALVYLHDNLLFAASYLGDSVLAELHTTPVADTTPPSYVSERARLPNLGPIVDLCLQDLEGGGQIVTCSGAYSEGSLRVIRNGVALQTHATVALPGVKGLWALPGTKGVEAFLLIASIHGTRTLSLLEGGTEIVEAALDGVAPEETLHAAPVTHGQAVQVTGMGVHLLQNGLRKFAWQPESGAITLAASHAGHVAVVVGGRKIVVLSVSAGALTSYAEMSLEHEAAALAVSSVGIAVAHWGNLALSLYAFPKLAAPASLPPPADVPASALLWAYLGDEPNTPSHLLVGRGDGVLHTYDVVDGEVKADTQRTVTLGTRALEFAPFTSEGGEVHVFVCGDRPAIVHRGLGSRLRFAYVNERVVAHLTSFNTTSIPGGVALVVEDELVIAVPDAAQELHVRAVALGEMPRRLVPHGDNYVVLTSRPAEHSDVSVIRLLAGQTLAPLTEHVLPSPESASAVAVVNGLLVVGTAIVLPDEDEVSKGRLLVFAVENQRLRLLGETEVRGAVYAIEALEDRILATVNAEVNVYAWDATADPPALTRECKQGGFVHALYASVRGAFVLVGDLVKSATLLLYDASERTLREIARDYAPSWTLAVAAVADDTFLIAEDGYNLYALRHHSDAPTDEERHRLDLTGEFHLGDAVNRLRAGSLVRRDTAGLAVPTWVYGTVGGAVGVVAMLDSEPDLWELLVRLQSAMQDKVPSVGNLKHADWRAFRNVRRTAPAHGFVDGDLIERFIDLPPALQSEIASDVDQSVADLTARLESLARSLH